MIKVISFNYYENKYGFGSYKCSEPNEMSGDYVSLADYQELEALLKRWNEIAPGASWVVDNAGNNDLADEINKLIQDTSEAIK